MAPQSPEAKENARRWSRDAKRKRKGRCVECGAPTSYAGAPGQPISLRCGKCAARLNGLRMRGKGYRMEAALELLALGPARYSEIKLITGCTQNQMRSLMGRLLRYGMVERVSRGVYALPDEGRRTT